MDVPRVTIAALVVIANCRTRLAELQWLPAGHGEVSNEIQKVTEMLFVQLRKRKVKSILFA